MWDLSYGTGSQVEPESGMGPELRDFRPSYFVEQVSLTIFTFTT